MTAMPFQASKPRPIESVQRALTVLRLFLEIEGDRGLSVSETARELDVAKSTVSRLLATLAADGFVTLDPDTRRYHVGIVAFQVGSRLKAAQSSTAARPILNRLAQATGHTAQIGTLHNAKVLYLAVAESETRLRVVASPGDLRDAHSSAMGKAILANLPAAELESVVDSLLNEEGGLPVSGPGTILEPQVLLEELRRIAERGYSTSHEEATEGVSAIGVRIPGLESVPLAVSVAFPSGSNVEGDQESWLVEQLKEAAGQMASILLPTSKADNDRAATRGESE